MPQITYSAKIENQEYYEDTEEIYGGTYTHEKPIKIMLQIWNNKYGLADVRDLENFALNFYFSDFEDSSLLQYLNVKYNQKEQLMLDIKDGVACATFFNDVVIKGNANNGDETNRENYIELEITFETLDSIDLKSQDLKSLFIEIVTL